MRARVVGVGEGEILTASCGCCSLDILVPKVKYLILGTKVSNEQQMLMASYGGASGSSTPEV